jgi:putative endonuclease
MNKNYTGYISNLIARFNPYNLLEPEDIFLKYRCCKVIHVEFFDSKLKDMKREKCLKTDVGLEFTQKLIGSQ